MQKIPLRLPKNDLEFNEKVKTANSSIVEELKKLKVVLSTYTNPSLSNEIEYIDALINLSIKPENSNLFFTSKLNSFEIKKIHIDETNNNNIDYTSDLKTLVTIDSKDLDEKPKSKIKTVKFYKILLGIFDYSKFKQIYYPILQENELFICVYCQAQNALYYKSKPESSTKLKWYYNLTLDHVSPKSKYPFLAININNLAPVCAHCNSRKNDKETNYNPYLDEFNYHFNFEETIDNIDVTKINIEKLKLLKIDSSKNDLLNSTLDLGGLYKHQSFIAQNLLDRYRKYSGVGYYKNIDGVFGKVSENELKNFISDCNLSEDNTFKFPFVRFKISLYNHFVSLENKKR
ncbi:MAG TPA: HNH endonuclease [Brumimicrobium sp.]|nr:HNH endonuclease [Brumimicrobium sp.]